MEALEEPASLIALRKEIKARMPRVDLPEILLEVAARTCCMEAFTHLTERMARAADLTTSLCAVLLAEACNTGPEPFVRPDTPALKCDRLLWVDQNYVRDDTLIACNATLVAAQNRIALARTWGGVTWPRPMACASSCQYAPSTPGQTRNTSIAGAASPGT